MKFNFKKIVSVLAGTVMLSSTLAFAAAANNYPAPFVKSGAADVAVVYGSQPGAEFDLLAVADITQSLQAKLAAQTAVGGSTSSSVSVTGEAAPLFSSSSKIYVNSTLNSVKTSITKTDMPTVLADQTFSGNVDAKQTQTILIGNVPIVTFAKQPTSSDDPVFSLVGSPNSGNIYYNATVDFNKAVNFTHADSKNQEITMFGQKFTVGSATTSTDLVLLKSATKLNFDSTGVTSQNVTIEGKSYIVELVSASTTAATVKVINSAGSSEQKEVTEGASKKVNGLTIAVNTADSNNQKYTASIVAGAEKVTLTSGSSVTYGESDTVIDGATAYITGTNTNNAATKIVISVKAPNSDKDAIISGTGFVDPVFGTFKVDFPGFSTGDNSTARETIKVQNGADDKLTIDVTDKRGNAKTGLQWAINKTSGSWLQWDNDGHNITVAEMQPVYKNEYVVVGNEDEGRLLKLTKITNATSSVPYAVSFQDVFSGDTIDATFTLGNSAGTATIGGKVYTVNYFGDTQTSDDLRYVRINYPDSTGNNMIVYPTITTQRGAKLFFYEPLGINLSAWNGGESGMQNLTGIMFPNGANAYQTLTTNVGAETQGDLNVTVTCGTSSKQLNVSGAITNSTNCALTSTGFTYNISTGGAVAGNAPGILGQGYLNLYLVSNDGNKLLNYPALGFYEEKDNNNVYNGFIVTPVGGSTSVTNSIKVNDFIRTWSSDSESNVNTVGTFGALTLASDSKKSKDADYWGTIAQTDTSDSNRPIISISYPDEQVYANLYLAANTAQLQASAATGTVGGTVKELGSVSLTDAQASQVSSKNLIVVGGSCVNTLASSLLGGAGCGASWETATGVGAGSFLIQSFDRTGGKVATLVAGYSAEDTRNAAKVLISDVTVDLSAGKKYKSTSATAVQMVTTEAAATTPAA